MPELSGIDFLRQVKSMEKYRDIPIIMVTGRASKYNVVEAVKAGAAAYITKPLDDVVLMDKLSQISF